MMSSNSLAAGAVVLVVVSAVAVPVAAGTDGRTGGTVAVAEESARDQRPDSNASVGAGDRLQGAVGVQEAEVAGELDSRRFAIEFAAADSNASKAGVVAGQVAKIDERLAALRERNRTLRQARENGSISAGEYRARVAVFAARTRAVETVANRTERAARGLPEQALRNRGVDVAAIQRLREDAAELSGGEVAEIARSIAGAGVGREMAAANRPEVAGPPRNASDGRRGGREGRSGGSEHSGRNDWGQSLAVPIEGAYEFVAGAAMGLASAALGSVVGTAAAQSQESTQRPVLEVPLREDGSARITLVLTFDLSEDAANRAFETLQNDDRARADVRDRFGDRMASIANQSADVTGREMRAHDPAIELSTADGGETGVVRVSVTWEGLAAREDGHLVVTEPFASGFTPDREFRVRITAPDSYRVTTARPDPETRSPASVTWPAGTSLDGFTLVFSPEQRTSLPDERIEELQPTGTISEPAQSPGVPGFGAGTALVAALAAGVLAARRRRQR